MIRGLFINLDRKPERRRRIEAELRRFKLAQFYERISAIDGHPGAPPGWSGVIGCFRSHLKALDIARRMRSAVHVIEDDVILSDRLKPFLESRQCAEALARFDLVFLDMWIENDTARRYHEVLIRAGNGLQLMNLRGGRIKSADSYLVAQRSVDKVFGLLAAEVARGPRLAVDMFYETMIGSGHLTAAVVVPFVTCIDIETGTESSIQSLSHDEQVQLAMLRTAFFVDPARQPSRTLPPLDAGDNVAPRPGVG